MQNSTIRSMESGGIDRQHTKHFSGTGSSAKAWGFDLDQDFMGYQKVDGEPNLVKFLAGENECDPRKGQLHAIVEAFLEASSEEAGHWSDLEKRLNQYEQTQRRASVLNNRLTGRFS